MTASDSAAASADRQEARDFGRRVSLFYFATFFLAGLHMPYFPVWLETRQLGLQEIGVVLALPMLARAVFSPVIGFIADRIGEHRRLLQAMCFGAFVSLLGLAVTPAGFWPILAVCVVFSFFWMTVIPLTDTVAMIGARKSGLDFARLRVWGSVAFIVANFGGGVAVGALGKASTLPMLILTALAALGCAFLLPRPRGLGRLKAATTGPRISLDDALRLARSPTFFVFLATTASLQSAHAMLFSFGTLHWQSLGISPETIGLLWSISILAEITLFTFATPFVRRFGVVKLLAMSGLASAVRWLVFATDPPLAVQFVCQTMHCLTFGLAYLAAMQFVSSAVPERLTATAQGLYTAVTAGIAIGGVMMLSGPLYARFGGHAFWFMSVLAAASLAGVLWLRGGNYWTAKALEAEMARGGTSV